MIDCVLAAAGQMNSSGLAFQLFDSFTDLQLQPTTDTYAAILHGCTQNNMLESVPMVTLLPPPAIALPRQHLQAASIMMSHCSPD